MGSKYALAPQLARVFDSLGGTTFIDPFSGSGFVSFLAKSLGFIVHTNDYMHFASVVAKANVTLESDNLCEATAKFLVSRNSDGRSFAARTYEGIFFDRADLDVIDTIWSNLDSVSDVHRQIAIAALVYAAAKKQPRGVFTISGDLSRYNDGRRELRTSLRQLFLESVESINAARFSTGLNHSSQTGNALDMQTPPEPDIVYLDPPYAPKADDADYTKRYHFLEGISTYWENEKAELMMATKTRKLPKRHSDYGSRKKAPDALLATFDRFSDARAIVLSYSSNSTPSLEWMIEALSLRKASVEIISIPHRYHFGTHSGVGRSSAREFIFIAKN